LEPRKIEAIVTGKRKKKRGRNEGEKKKSNGMKDRPSRWGRPKKKYRNKVDHG